MELQECFDLMNKIKSVQRDISTPVGACKSLQDYMDSIYKGHEKPVNSGIVTIGSCLPNGDYALYATFPNRIIPEKWCGFPVINTSK